MRPITALAAALVAVALTCRSVLADNGYNTYYSRCFEAPNPININLCVNFNLDTCNQALDLNVTSGDSTLFRVAITRIADYQGCFTPGGVTQCQSCVQFSEATLTPSYANLCPEVYTRCQFLPLPPITSTTPLGCVTLGVNCAEQPSCSACIAASDDCGWCGNFTHGNCMIKGVDGGAEPYCSTCALNTASATVWAQNDAQCPADPAAGDGKSWAARNLGIVVGVPVGGFALLAGVAVCCIVYRRRKAGGNQAPPHGAQPLADQADSAIVPVDGSTTNSTLN